MNWLRLPRTPEPEVMDAAAEIEAYSSATAQAYLDALDDTLVDQIVSLGIASGRLLDVGCGPGGIAKKIARRLPQMRVVGVDFSVNMISAAKAAAAAQDLSSRVHFFSGDAKRLPFPERSFDFVLSNSVLHHLHDPLAMLDEMARVAKPGGIVLLRDLRRPGRLIFPLHVSWFGRHYSGLMKKLYTNSVRAAYTGAELAQMLSQSRLAAARVFYHERTHLGFVYDGRAAGHS